METNLLTEEQLQEAFCEVRKAHRLIYEYQRRMQDLTWFIKNKLGFKIYEGHKQFSDTLKSSNKISVNSWSWDWIYTYVYEYHLGELDKQFVKLSLIQVSDTGYYQKIGKGGVKTKLNTFADVEESESKLIFYLSIKSKLEESYIWDVDRILKKYIVEDEFFKIDDQTGRIQIVYSVPLSKLLNEEATMQILREFVQFCNENAGTNLKIQESEQ